ncbi:MAG: tetratricopeptide repeat protein [Bacteroidota bacterium]|nr:tetratricopeptide repeat protein [Bacteroidota bacterium]
MKLSFTYLFLLLNFGCVSSYAQKEVIDSLELVLSSPYHDTIKVDAMRWLAIELQESNRPKAFEKGKESLEYARKISFKRGEGHSLNALGDLYWFAGDYTKASDNYFQALKIFESLKDKASIAQCYRNIGWIYQGQKNYTLTVEYYLKSLKINKELGLELQMIANHDDLGIAYKMMGNYPAALEYCKKTIELSKKMNSEKGLATAYGNLGMIYYEMGNYDLALESYLSSNILHRKLEDHYNLAEGYNGLALCYMKLQQYDKAISFSEKALQIGLDHDFKTVQSDVYKLLSDAYEKKKDFQASFKYLVKYTALQDSTYNENNSKQINEMSAKYESDKKELLINSLENDKTLAQEQRKKEENFRIYLIILCVTIVLLAFFLFRGIIKKKKTNSALTHAYKEIEVKNKDITDSINYAKRIQDVSLPADQIRKDLFPESFILFKPKDIVSGDFYWYTEKDGRRIIAACDCTGHGVPGALMSMIGNNILNQVINEKGITSSGEILQQVDSELRKALKQDEYAQNRDGMDIAILVFNSENEIEFSGAQRPLWIIQNEELTEIKGTKHSIGGLQATEKVEFKTNTIRLKKDDLLYIFSDGYADQFGGEQGKKFMTKNLKALLLQIKQEPMPKQSEILNSSIESWSSKTEQVDDILVIGIKIT